MRRIVLFALVAVFVSAPVFAASSNRSRATAKVHMVKKPGPKWYQGNYNPNKGHTTPHRAK